MKNYNNANIKLSHQRILDGLKFSGAIEIGHGAEGIAYRYGGLVIKISVHKNFETSFKKMDEISIHKDYRCIAKVIDCGTLFGYDYSIKEYLNPISDKIKYDIDAYIDSLDIEKDPDFDPIYNLFLNRKKIKYDNFNSNLLFMFDEYQSLISKAGVDSDIGYGNMGIDNTGLIKSFD